MYDKGARSREYQWYGKNSSSLERAMRCMNKGVEMSRDGLNQSTRKECGPRKGSVPESRELRFRQEGTASSVWPLLGDQEGE